MPKEGENKLVFQNYHKQLPAPYIIYADFEALTAKVEGSEPDPAKSNTQRTQHHEACSYSYIVVRCDGHTEPPVEYRGPNAAGHFLESLQEEERKIKAVLADPKAMRMTRGDWRAFRVTETCHVCDKPLEGDSVRDHCHITGKYRGAAHTTSSYGYPPKPPLSPLSSTICVAMTPTCWCRPSRRWRAGSTASQTTPRSISPSPFDNCASLTASNSCWPPLTGWWRRTRQRLSG